MVAPAGGNEARHEPVMVTEVTGLLGGRGTVVDMTVGLGGHAAALLDSGVRAVIGVDRDTAALRRLLGDDLVYVHSNGLVESKDHLIETLAIRRMVYDSIVPLEMSHRIFGEAAVGNGKVRVQAQMGGQTLRVDLLFTTVHVRRRGVWQLVAWQSTRAP